MRKAGPIWFASFLAYVVQQKTGNVYKPTLSPCWLIANPPTVQAGIYRSIGTHRPGSSPVIIISLNGGLYCQVLKFHTNSKLFRLHRSQSQTQRARRLEYRYVNLTRKHSNFKQAMIARPSWTTNTEHRSLEIFLGVWNKASRVYAKEKITGFRGM